MIVCSIWPFAPTPARAFTLTLTSSQPPTWAPGCLMVSYLATKSGGDTNDETKVEALPAADDKAKFKNKNVETQTVNIMEVVDLQKIQNKKLLQVSYMKKCLHMKKLEETW